MFCSQCGGKLLDEAKFCSSCGSGVADASKAVSANPILPPTNVDAKDLLKIIKVSVKNMQMFLG